MRFISHRGNIDGPQADLENNPTYIKQALKMGYDVEVDVWWSNDAFLLGHDEPAFEVDKKFLENRHIWCHAKNVEALNKLLTPFACHVFWHENDRMATTSHGFIWHFPTFHKFTRRSVCVLPEVAVKDDKIPKFCYGICSDYIAKYEEDYSSSTPLLFK